MYNPNLTKGEIREYLHIYNEVTDWNDKSVAGEDASVETIQDKNREAKLTRQLVEFCTILIANRLWQNNRAVPLITQNDVDDLLQHLIKTSLKKFGFLEDSFASEKTTLEGMRAFVMPALGTIVSDLSKPTAYDDEWRKIEIMQCVCDELNVMPEELLHISGIGEQIIRHLYPDKEEYRAELEKALQDARSGIPAFRIKMYQHMLIEYGDELSEDVEREIRVMVDEDTNRLEQEFITAHTRRIEKIMRRIWPE